MKMAYCLIRRMPCYRRDSFVAGLSALGYQVRPQPPRGEGYKPGDLLVIWNRYGRFHDYANQCEAQGGLVIVAENGYLGREWNGGYWYALSAHHHNGAGEWFPGGPERWDSFGVEVQPRRGSLLGEVVILPQRGIGPPGVAMPNNWAAMNLNTIKRVFGGGVRIRNHPGENQCTPLRDDLAAAWVVVTWGSGAALKAMLWGVPCAHMMRQWIGAPGSRFVDADHHLQPRPDTRLAMFRRLAWAMWTTDEIATGEPFRRLIDGVSENE